MFRRIFTRNLEKILLGRWERTCEKANTIKVYWANIDHCGTCSGQKVDDKTNEDKTKMKPIKKS